MFKCINETSRLVNISNLSKDVDKALTVVMDTGITGIEVSVSVSRHEGPMIRVTSKLSGDEELIKANVEGTNLQSIEFLVAVATMELQDQLDEANETTRRLTHTEKPRRIQVRRSR